ncbi:hypothetical protein Q3G72_016058 [Acer saccharum]|nr:hypothetical protein Q3G72_016058 [Acer saccharum]
MVELVRNCPSLKSTISKCKLQREAKHLFLHWWEKEGSRVFRNMHSLNHIFSFGLFFTVMQRVVVLDPTNELLVCKISGHCFELLLSLFETEQDPKPHKLYTGVSLVANFKVVPKIKDEKLRSDQRYINRAVHGIGWRNWIMSWVAWILILSLYNCEDEKELEVPSRFVSVWMIPVRLRSLMRYQTRRLVAGFEPKTCCSCACRDYKTTSSWCWHWNTMAKLLERVPQNLNYGAYGHLIQYFGDHRLPHQAKQLHARLVLHSVTPDNFLASKLVTFYSKVQQSPSSTPLVR